MPRGAVSRGLIDKIPKLGIIQVEGCAPMVNAFKAGKEVAEAVVPETSIIILSTGDPGKAYTYLWSLTQQFGGVMEAVERTGSHFNPTRVVGKLDVRVDRVPAAMLSLSAHKVGGPKGVGLLFAVL